MAVINGSIFNDNNTVNGVPLIFRPQINGTNLDDTINALAGDDLVFGNGGNDTIVGADGKDTLDGGDGNDVLVGDNFGGTSDDSLRGGAGNDVFNGGLGKDTLAGGADSDTYAISLTDTVIIEQANEGNDLVNSSVSFTLGANLERLTLVGTANIKGTGNALDNTILGNSANNTLDGLAGNDVMNGLDGNDTLTGGLGNDTLAGGNGIDRVVEAGNVNFTLTDTQLIGNGTDTLQTIENVFLTGGVSANVLDASTFNGSVGLNGGFGNDQLKGGTKGSNLFGGSGNDTVIGGVGTDSLFGDNEDDRLEGAGNNDELKGGDGNDTLIGGDGNDDLRGERGNDVISGGTGSDSILIDSIDATLTLSNTKLEIKNAGLTETDTLSSIEKATLFGRDGGNIMSASGFSGQANLFGAGGNDTLTGGSGSDSLAGGEGTDSVNGFADDPFTIERDTLSGGGGLDFFVLGFNFGFGAIGYSDFGAQDFATLQDFNAGQGDRIRVGGDSLSEYSLFKQSVAGVGSGAVDTQIFRGSELIAVVQDNTDVSITRDFQIFG